jgi:hypothetical protein
MARHALQLTRTWADIIDLWCGKVYYLRVLPSPEVLQKSRALMTTQNKDSHWFSVGIILAGCVLVVVLSMPEKPAPPQSALSQRKPNDGSAFDSYWPTTNRVDTDMDSFWLLNEERV